MEKAMSKSRTTEVSALAIRLIEFNEKQEKIKNDMFLSQFFDTLKIQSAALTVAINKSRILSKLEEKDEARDEQIRALNALLKGYMKFPDDNVKANAERLIDIYNGYGSIILRTGYASETSLIESLLVDFSEPNAAASIAALSGVGQLVDKLREANNEFIRTRVEYEREMSLSALSEPASKIKIAIANMINQQLIVYLDAKILTENELYGDYYNAVQKIIKTNNDTVLRRYATNKKDKKSD